MTDTVQPTPQAYGIVDPDYARIYTQARVLAWQYGFALTMNGSFTRDLDLVLIPWEEHASNETVSRFIAHLPQAAGLHVVGIPGNKPHGRKAYTLKLNGPDEVRWVDLSVLPCP